MPLQRHTLIAQDYGRESKSTAHSEQQILFSDFLIFVSKRPYLPPRNIPLKFPAEPTEY